MVKEYQTETEEEHHLVQPTLQLQRRHQHWPQVLHILHRHFPRHHLRDGQTNTSKLSSKIKRERRESVVRVRNDGAVACNFY